MNQFVLFMFIPSDKRTASKFRVKLMLEDSQTHGSKEQRLYEKQVLSIEEFTRYEDIPESHSIRIHEGDAKNFVHITKNQDPDPDYTVHLPIEIIEIIYFDD